MNDLTQVFDFEDQAIRVVAGPDGEPWFVGKDVCRALALDNTSMALDRLGDDEKGISNVDTVTRGAQEMLIVAEPGVYRLIFTSRKEEAERFKRWLAHDVLPALRKDGYVALPDVEPEPAELEAIGADLEELRVWLRIVENAKSIAGNRAARCVWAKSPLPPLGETEEEGELVYDAPNDAGLTRAKRKRALKGLSGVERQRMLWRLRSARYRSRRQQQQLN